MSLQRALILCSVFLVGCASLQQNDNFDADWAFTGKMAVRNASEASSVNVTWTQLNQSYDIELSGPLGQGVVAISGQPGSVTMTQGDNRYTAETLSDLVRQTTNLDLPLDHIQYWVRGRASPLSPSTAEKNEMGQIIEIKQDAWLVNIDDYFENADALPKKLQFAREENLGKLVIREWILPTQP